MNKQNEPNNEPNKEKSPEEIKAENKSMIRACITGVIVLVLFVCVFFLGGGRSEKNTQPKQNAKQNITETSEPKKETNDLKNEPANEGDSGEKSEEGSEDIYKKYDIKYTRDDALKEAEIVAKKQFGDDAFVIPASEEIPSEVEIDGEQRPCYMFGADSMSHLSGENASMRGLYHFDAVTGEIFDNANGEMKKIN